MLDRLVDWLDRQPPKRRRLYGFFIAVILLTLPCYASGLVLLALCDASPPTLPTVEPGRAPTAIVRPAERGLAASPTAIQRRATPSPAITIEPTSPLRPVLAPITVVPTLVIIVTETPQAPRTAVPVPTATSPPLEKPSPTSTSVEFVPVITVMPIVPPGLVTPGATP